MSKMAVAVKLAKLHYDVIPETKHIFLVEPLLADDPAEPIKLLEVVDGAVERGVEPLYFAPNPGRGVPYATVIIELSPREFKELKPEALQLEKSTWTLGEELPR